MKTDDEIKAEALPMQTSAKEALEFTTGTTIQNQAELEFMVSSIAEMKGAEAQVTKTRDLFVQPLLEVIAKYRGYFDPALKDLAKAIEQGRGRIAEYATRTEETRARMIDESENAPTQAVRDAVLVQADSYRVDEVAGLSLRTTWTGEVTDANLIPREYLVVDVQKLKAVTRAKKGDPKIPGWKGYAESTAAITASKVNKG